MHSLVSRGYFIHGRMCREVRLQCFGIARCQTPSVAHLLWSISGLLFPVGSQKATSRSRLVSMLPYISRTLILDTRVIHRGSAGSFGPFRIPMDLHWNSDIARRGSPHHSTVLLQYQCTIDARTHAGPYGVPTGPPRARRNPTPATSGPPPAPSDHD